MGKNIVGVKNGLIGGCIIGLLYIGLLWMRYDFFSFNPFAFMLSSFINFMIFVAFLTGLAHFHKKALGGVATIKDLFQALFVAILLIEVILYVFNYVYLTQINPEFYTQYEKDLVAFGKSRKMPEEQIKNNAASIRAAAIESKQFWRSLTGIFPKIILDSIFAVMVAFLIRSRLNEDQIQAWRAQQQKSILN